MTASSNLGSESLEVLGSRLKQSHTGIWSSLIPRLQLFGATTRRYYQSLKARSPDGIAGEIQFQPSRTPSITCRIYMKTSLLTYLLREGGDDAVEV